MFIDWSDLITAAIQTLQPLHRHIVVRTMEIPGKRNCLYYSEGKALWNLDRKKFARQRNAAIDAVRIYVVQHGLSSPADLAVL
jgi:hypothetical protein